MKMVRVEIKKGGTLAMHHFIQRWLAEFPGVYHPLLVRPGRMAELQHTGARSDSSGYNSSLETHELCDWNENLLNFCGFIVSI